MKITKMERVQEGYLTARVTMEPSDPTVQVHRRYGSWLRDVPDSTMMAELPRAVSAALAGKARLFEKRERNGEAQPVDALA